MIKQVGNNLKLMDDNHLKKIIKESYDRGILFGIKTTANAVLKNLNEMTSDNFEEIKERLVQFCANVQAV